MGDGIGQFNEAPLIEEKHEPSMRLPSPPTASSASQVLLAAGRAFAGVSCTYECWINREVADLKLVGCARNRCASKTTGVDSTDAPRRQATGTPRNQMHDRQDDARRLQYLV